MSKAHILVVEDEALIYRRLKKMLVQENYTVAAYTPSVSKALVNINTTRPDIVLLDIELQGEQTGLDLGKILHEEYQIPFIYVTGFDDNETFFKAITTHQVHYFVKTKPRLNNKELLRVIQTALFNTQKEQSPVEQKVKIQKNHIIGYVDFIQNTKNLGKNSLHQKTVELSNISIFTTNSNVLDKQKTKLKGKEVFKKLAVANYVRFVDQQDNSLYLPYSLKNVFEALPDYFAQISEDVIVNLLPENLIGIRNGSEVQIKNHFYTVTQTYKNQLQKRLDSLYFTSKNMSTINAKDLKQKKK